MSKRIVAMGLLGLALGIWRLPLASAAENYVYTANERGNSISAVDLGTGQARNIDTPITPHNVQVSRDGRLLLAVGTVAEKTATPAPMKMTEEGDIAAAEGLEYIYLGNLQSETGENTYCPQCQKLLIQRIGFSVLQNRLRDGHCPDCGKEIYGIWK